MPRLKFSARKKCKGPERIAGRDLHRLDDRALWPRQELERALGSPEHNQDHRGDRLRGEGGRPVVDALPDRQRLERIS